VTFATFSTWDKIVSVFGLLAVLAGIAVLAWDIWMAVKEEKEIGDEAGKQD
jgi:hypothetical protein